MVVLPSVGVEGNVLREGHSGRTDVWLAIAERLNDRRLPCGVSPGRGTIDAVASPQSKLVGISGGMMRSRCDRNRGCALARAGISGRARQLSNTAMAVLVATLLPAGVMASNSNPILVGGPGHPMPLRPPGFSPASAPAGAHLTYYGGRVISNPQIVIVLWGSGSYLPEIASTASPSMATFYQGVLNSPYICGLSEYDTNITAAGGAQGTNQSIGPGSFLQQITITPSTNSSTIADAVVQSELNAQIDAGHLPAPTTDAQGNTNTIYMVYFPHGKTIHQGGSSSCVSGGFCAYHGTFVRSGNSVYYGVMPDMQVGSGCEYGCGGAPTTFQNETSVSSHELVEAITDAEVGLASVIGPPVAWYDSTNGEIGDICNAQQGTVVGSDGVTYTVQRQFSNIQNDCVLERAGVTCPPAACVSDASCAAGDWCNESPGACTPKLPNGAPIPTDPPHTNPTLNGTCTAAAGGLVCASGVCDATDNECGFANGDGACTQANGPTVCRSGACSSNGRCEPSGGCNVDTDCTLPETCGGGGAANVCGNRCANVTCPATDPCHDAVCDPATGNCSNRAKPDGTTCSDGNACTSNDVCTSGLCAGAPDAGDPVALGDTVRVDKAPANATVSWTDPSGPYIHNVYRGGKGSSDSWLYNQSSLANQRGVQSDSADDADIPPPAHFFYYLITRVNGTSCESPLGTDSSGAQRPNATPSPLTPRDADGDGVPDYRDNCPAVANQGQSDGDQDGVGNACDNCPVDSNPDQSDIDGNRLGDACDPDIDGDGVPNGIDNCPYVANNDQADSNGNGIGDACDGSSRTPRP